MWKFLGLFRVWMEKNALKKISKNLGSNKLEINYKLKIFFCGMSQIFFLKISFNF